MAKEHGTDNEVTILQVTGGIDRDNKGNPIVYCYVNFGYAVGGCHVSLEDAFNWLVKNQASKLVES